MSMLAEPRRKQKWTLNPRGKQWSEDSNKFGQKMLEKMGWTIGKGLGAHEQGMTEHVRVSYKDDTAGIGFKKDHLDKAWTEHQDSFNDFLQQLQKSKDHNVIQIEEVKSELSGKSLELKSRQSKARVHYNKFTRGKDVNKYSPKDLANIFGQKELNVEEDKEESKNKNHENVKSDPPGIQDIRSGVITINGGSMADYFLKKGQNLSLTSKKKKQQESNSDSEPEYAGFGFASTVTKENSRNGNETKETGNICDYAFENLCLRLNSPENTPSTNSKLESSKKRKISDDNESGLSNNRKKFKEGIKNDYNVFENAALNLESTTSEMYNGKEFEVCRVEFGVTNSALDLHDEVVEKKRVTFNDRVEYSTDSAKKKKGKAMLDKFEVENKKSKKKKKSEENANNFVPFGIVNEALDVEEVSEEMNDNEINERKSRKSKKRKGSCRTNLETIVEIPEEVGEDEMKTEKLDDVHQEDPSNKKSKKKKEKIEIPAISEHNALENAEEAVNSELKTELEKEDHIQKLEDQANCSEEKEKKKKKRKKKDAERNIGNHEGNFEIQTESSNIEHVKQEIEIAEEETVKLKKKKKKMRKDLDETDINKAKHEKLIKDIVECIPNRASTPERMEETVNTKITHTNSRNTKSTHQLVKDTTFNASSSPWNERAKTSKKILMSLFNRNSIAHFPGSNVHEIKGYGIDIYNKE
ncbi:PREDICTED: putative histone-lysine N-methyltransferase 1 [Dufourea novaeangliae]|uniref:putative histone-lysine N-methyltransferase 1 n=1 Tax=Dufourea novaeangliae TaxID=178035 RepID=UPI000767B530|nr:PREDICTED: putative histone-lysine N-methyltransferase 1 [Dufourea novaeangliae]